MVPKSSYTAPGDGVGENVTKASIVHNIGFCLHSLGEFESAKAYYEMALEQVQHSKTSLLDRWTYGLIYGDANSNRIMHIKARLHDCAFRKRPEGNDFCDEKGRRTGTSPPAPLRAKRRIG